MSESEFLNVEQVELQEKSSMRINLLQNLSRRPSMFPGQMLQIDLPAFKSDIENDDEDEAEEMEVPVPSNRKFSFPYKEMTNEKLGNVRNRLGIIDLSFPEKSSEEWKDKYPTSYFTVTDKEKILLLFAENFRRQYNEKYKHRKSLMLAPRNECGVQKFVSTTIRPTSFVFPEFIGSWSNISSFVADFIEYQCLEIPTELPQELISPDSLLKQRKGHCFEMSTLLASMLLGGGFNAFVVSGYATREITTNNQARVSCPAIPQDEIPIILEDNCEESDEEEEIEQISSRYKLKDPIDLNSQFLIQLEQDEVARIEGLQQLEMELERKRLEEEEKLPLDEFEGVRVHSWVLVLSPEEIFFIEPSTGFRHEIFDPGFIGIESVWNHENYFVNRQEVITGSIAEIDWDLENRDNWERLLLIASDLTVSPGRELKSMDMPISWVTQLKISGKEFEDRFPKAEKRIDFKRAVHEKFAAYKNVDGLVERVTTFKTLDYQEPVERWEYYMNRKDLLARRKTMFVTNSVEEHFGKGRPDSVKSILRSANDMANIIKFEFYAASRFDCLRALELEEKTIREYYNKREDLLYYREFVLNEPLKNVKLEQLNILESVIEKFRRNKAKSANKDIAIRRFLLMEKKICLKYQYEKYCITAATREFIKPATPNYMDEIKFDPSLTKSFNGKNPEPSNVELYLLLLEQLAAEDKSVDAFYKRLKDIEHLRECRDKENHQPRLKFSIFDPLRNDEARKLRLQKYELMAIMDEAEKRESADLLGPYLVKHSRELVELCSQIKEGSISKEASKHAFENCLKDLKHHHSEMLKELEYRNKEALDEANQFKEFLIKFHDQFTDEDLENIKKEGESIQRYKNVVKKRIQNLKEESEAKFQEVKTMLLNDHRLNSEFRMSFGK